MELHPLLSRRREAQAITWQGYGEVADLQIPKFELLFRFCVNIYYFKNHYRTENNQILLLSVTVTRCHGVAVSNTTVNTRPLILPVLATVGQGHLNHPPTTVVHASLHT